MARRPGIVAASLVLGALAAAAALVAAEAALGLADYPPAYTNHQQLFVEYDSVRGWRNVPGAVGRYVTSEYAVELAYNARAYRGPLHPYRKPPGVYRVLVLGDSYVEGYTVALPDRVAEVATTLLQRRNSGPTVEIVALGTGGYSTDQEDLWLEGEGLRYAPDLVIVFFVTNDIWFNAQPYCPRGAKPMFQLVHDSLVLANVPVPRPSPRGTTEAARGPWRAAKHFVREHSRLVRLAEHAMRRTAWLQGLGIRLGLIDALAATVATVRGQRTIPAEFSVFATRLSPQGDTALAVTERLLARMQARSQAAGAQFTVMLVPANEALYPPGAARSTRYHRVPPVGDEHRASERFHDICARARVSCVDPTAQFVAAADSLARRHELLVFPEDEHWNENGHRLAATVLAGLVRQELRGKGAPVPRAERER